MLQHNRTSPSRTTHRIPHLQTEKEKNYTIVLTDMHYSIGPDDMKIEIEKLGHTITNI
jgi:hypothetical protein